MAEVKKVYDYKRDRVQDTLTKALKRTRGRATVADLVARTGLPRYQVETELPAVSDEYAGRLEVTDSGEILYSFPRGFVSRYRGLGPSLRRSWKAFKKTAASVATFLFKAWIMVMLVGYFVLFILLAVLAVVASMAGQGKDNRSRGRSSGGGFMAGRLIELFVRIWFYNEMFKTPGQRAMEGAYRSARAQSKPPRRPLHKAIFSFVFGEPDPGANQGTVERKALAALAARRGGILLLEDFMAITGLPPQKAETEISRYLYEFEGSPEVSPQGTVYYRFPGLVRRAQEDGYGAADAPLAPLRPFSANPGTSNTWYAGINGVNLLFGSYYLFSALTVGLPAGKLVIKGGTALYAYTLKLFYEFLGLGPGAVNVILVGLGIVPIVFSVLFWLVPAVRAARLKAQNERVKLANLRRVLYAQALDRPGSVAAPDPRSLPESARPADSRAAVRELERLAAYEGGDPGPDGRSWRLSELERKTADVASVRAGLRPDDYELGATAFDTDK
ncbi:MAG: hypothetical protein JW923_12395 [Spirochaetales bacterium]|nr:hypothetical protein [Spirochaetales bacterium]MBP7263135.1 hypothetical protein [Spirochaetia bacterium]